MAAFVNHLLCFGLGFSAKALAARLAAKGWHITGTSRSAAGAAAIRAMGYNAFIFDGTAALPQQAFEGVSHIVVSAPPDTEGDPVLRRYAKLLATLASDVKWLAYLSTTGVYGDRDGGWVSEESQLQPTTERGQRRLEAETAWQALGLPVHLFRLAGIYGPGRNQLVALMEGTAKRILKPGQVFSRIHVDDVAGVLEASITKPNPGAAYNVCDDEPCPPQDVVSYAAKLLGLPEPPGIAFEGAQLSAMARSFYTESKRVSNVRMKKELGVRLRYPNYREGLAALLQDLKR
ncbi:MAG: SDR family oxidoreductase [Aestuariivirga sp.]